MFRTRLHSAHFSVAQWHTVLSKRAGNRVEIKRMHLDYETSGEGDRPTPAQHHREMPKKCCFAATRAAGRILSIT
jgi:hypothetical protein